MKSKYAARIRRGIHAARNGGGIDFRNEDPLTIDACIRTLWAMARKDLINVLEATWEQDAPDGHTQ